ncbi:MAG: hypothetical protein ACOX6V_02005 [Patescibacteria group bacterium]
MLPFTWQHCQWQQTRSVFSPTCSPLFWSGEMKWGGDSVFPAFSVSDNGMLGKVLASVFSWLRLGRGEDR